MAVLLSVTLTSCSNHLYDDTSDYWKSQTEAVQEYYIRQSELVLPENTSWESELPAVLKDDSPNHYYAKGVGAQEAELQWYCIWGKHALKTRKREDFLELDKIKHMTVYEKADDVTQHIFDNIQNDLIVNGITDSLAEEIATNCR